MRGDLVLRVIAKLLIPFILVFALYVQFHGDFGPGGGFQAGVIVAAAIIFHALIYGLPITRRVVPEWVVEILVASGILIYMGVGVATMLLGGNFLDYSRGIFLVELGVGITVTGVMLMIFYMFAGRSRSPHSEK
jgi:multicomponent Na+:H+ antiporter subunit B